MSKTCTASVPTLAALFLPVALLLIPNCTGQGKAKPWTSKQIAAAVAKFEAHVKAKADKDAVEVLDEIILAL